MYVYAYVCEYAYVYRCKPYYGTACHTTESMCVCVLWFTKADKLIDAWTLAKHKLHRWLHNNWGVYYNVCSHFKRSKSSWRLKGSEKAAEKLHTRTSS